MLDRRMSLRSWSLAALCLAVVSGCRCTEGAVDPLPGDSGLVVTGCTTDEECGLGETCQGGLCKPAQVVDDAGIECTVDADCGPGRRCVPSTGRCVDIVIDPDGGTSDDAGIDAPFTVDAARVDANDRFLDLDPGGGAVCGCGAGGGWASGLVAAATLLWLMTRRRRLPR